MLVTLPVGMLQSRCDPGLSDNVKIQGFFCAFAYRGVDKAARHLDDAREKRVIIETESSG